MQDTAISPSPFQTLLAIWGAVPVLYFSGIRSRPSQDQVEDVRRGQYTQGMRFGPAWKSAGEASMLPLPAPAELPPLHVSSATSILTVIAADSTKANLGA